MSEKTAEERALDFLRESPRPHRLLIFAGNRREAYDWTERHGVGLAQWIEADSQRVRGLQGPLAYPRSSLRLVLVGTYRERKDYAATMEQLGFGGFVDAKGRPAE